MILLRICLVISLLAVFVTICNAQFTDAELRIITLKLDNYAIITQENKLLKEKLSIQSNIIYHYEYLDQSVWYENKYLWLLVGLIIGKFL